MNQDDKKILNWTIEKIKKEYPEDVALLIGHGFNTAEDFDSTEQYKGEIDYYVPEHPRANSLSKSFIVDNVCYDIYPRTWDSIESMAMLNDCHTACLANASVLYARSEQDRERFEQLRSRLFENLKDPKVSLEKARKRLGMAREIFNNMLFEQSLYEVRTSAGFVLDYLAQCIALVNHRYFHQNSLYQLEEMRSFENYPAEFPQLYEQVIQSSSADEIKTLCYRMLVCVSAFLPHGKSDSAPRPRPDFHDLADWYQEFGHLWRKIYSGCMKKDSARVFMWGCMLQHELDVISEEFNLGGIDLLGSYDADDFTKLHQRAQEIERHIIDVIVRNSIQIAIYSTVADFLSDN